MRDFTELKNMVVNMLQEFGYATEYIVGNAMTMSTQRLGKFVYLFTLLWPKHCKAGCKTGFQGLDLQLRQLNVHKMFNAN